MSFSDLLKQPLPSSRNRFMVEDTDLDDNLDEIDSDYDEDYDTEGCCNQSEDSDDPFDGYDDSDEDYDSDDSCDGCSNGYDDSDDPFDGYDDSDEDYDSDDSCDGCSNGYDDSDEDYDSNKSYPNEDPDAPPPPLTPEQSQRVDDTMNTVGTHLLLNSELNDEEIKEFVESADSDIMENEGFLTEKTIVKLDKNAKREQLYELALRTVSREHKDPLYKKLETVYKMERTIKARLRKKYHSQIQQKVKEYLARAKKSKSGILSKIAQKLSGRSK